VTITSGDVERYVGHLASADRAQALEMALTVGERVPPVQVITDLLGAAQIEVGRRWQANEWDVGREYAATSITDYVLAAVSRRWPVDTRAGPQIVVLCAEGESHALPARMQVELLRLHGWPVTMLGASLPAEYLESYLRRHRVLAAAVSCTLARSLPGDVTILVDFVRWQEAVLTARGEPTMAAAIVDSVSSALGDNSPSARQALQAGS